MCGIAGIVSFDGLGEEAPALAVAMRDVLTHRGPDEAGLHVDRVAALAHRRLSIIDLGNGQQPLGNEDGTVWIVFNGEIYNHADLRAELRAQAAIASAPSPTPRSIVHAYEEMGRRLRRSTCAACSPSPSGTRRSSRLLLARDRLGREAALLRHVSGDAVTFGSEIKALLPHRACAREWNPDALDAYLAFQYIPDPGRSTATSASCRRAHLLVAEQGRVCGAAVLDAGAFPAARRRPARRRAR